jgi:hypothetical protein
LLTTEDRGSGASGVTRLQDSTAMDLIAFGMKVASPTTTEFPPFGEVSAGKLAHLLAACRSADRLVL